MRIIKSAVQDLIDAPVVEVEASFTKGMPSFTIVGMVNTSITSKDRVKSALLINNFKFPPLKITINLSPSDLNKKGTHFDLSIALQIALFNEEKIDFMDYFYFGELSLDGTIKDTNYIFAIVLSLSKKGLLKKVLVCRQSAEKLINIPNIEVYVVESLNSAIEFVKSNEKEKYLYKKKQINYKEIDIITPPNKYLI
ncbi:magnesium chelatase domain-containing protein [Aliarcobacter cibarius]|uniref:ATP-binding protein n=1 Tax=Aliarcobacter cibarius TaxID=255507 RepID=A0ABY2V1L3_9BACT|nr:magnesium chelatase domain-containing protein [Aliarcobacter cibarius]TLS95722.1 ATP-binding protein [Aliarcobacter cibarius]TLS96295.1 ATP-binding protein [Aliarcobacter cibarius]